MYRVRAHQPQRRPWQQRRQRGGAGSGAGAGYGTGLPGGAGNWMGFIREASKTWPRGILRGIRVWPRLPCEQAGQGGRTSEGGPSDDEGGRVLG
ncbi:hypothetical protein LX36DRAFT_658253 [Colletotrichum falcatum]|nr:hypothetical protein LX36DRAFT_658253 [Colletotrichum falcatum]